MKLVETRRVVFLLHTIFDVVRENQAIKDDEWAQTKE